MSPTPEGAEEIGTPCTNNKLLGTQTAQLNLLPHCHHHLKQNMYMKQS